MSKSKAVFRVGVVVTLVLLFVTSTVPALLLESSLRMHYLGGLLAGGCIVFITALLAREW
jgi:uncharacterized membrane protein YdcZ (DUF606 family)